MFIYLSISYNNTETIISGEIYMMNYKALGSILKSPPAAYANVRGKDEYCKVCANIYFYKVLDRILVVAEAQGLPQRAGKCERGVFGFHIHEGESCTGNEIDAYADAKTHYNPLNCPHPKHSGDMPPLFENNGSAFMTFMTDRFTVEEIVGKTIIIHSNTDDFTTQPGGNSGEKIACGIIKRNNRLTF